MIVVLHTHTSLSLSLSLCLVLSLTHLQSSPLVHFSRHSYEHTWQLLRRCLLQETSIHSAWSLAEGRYMRHQCLGRDGTWYVKKEVLYIVIKGLIDSQAKNSDKLSISYSMIWSLLYTCIYMVGYLSYIHVLYCEHTHTHTRSLSLSYTHTHTRSLSLSYTHTHTHTYSHVHPSN